MATTLKFRGVLEHFSQQNFHSKKTQHRALVIFPLVYDFHTNKRSHNFISDIGMNAGMRWHSPTIMTNEG